MTDTIPLDSNWIAATRLSFTAAERQRIAGDVCWRSAVRLVPSALRLTDEAALRVGAGKLQMATIASAAIRLDLVVPKEGVLAPPQDADREIDRGAGPSLEKSLKGCDLLIIGPGVGSTGAANALLRLILMEPCDEVTLVVDALAIGSGRICAKRSRRSTIAWCSYRVTESWPC